MPGFMTDLELFDLVSAALKRGSIDVTSDAPYWQRIVKRSNQAAYNEIRRQLTVRGYSAAQIAAWDDGDEFQEDIGTWWSMVYGGCLGAFDDKLVRELDRRKELASVAVLNGGVLQEAAGNTEGSIGHGSLATTKDIFGLDPDDENLGKPTVW